MDKLREELTCPVCMDLLQNAVSLVPCQHIFCEACILPVLRQQQSKCPVCRATTEMLCQSRLARNAASLVASERSHDVQYQLVPASGLRMVPAAFPLRPSGKRSAIYQVQFDLYPYDTLSFYGPEHTAELAEALAVNTTVMTALFCELGSMHARFVVAAMYANRCLTKLSLCNCSLHDGNALDLAHMLSVNRVLIKLVLDGNGIGDAGLTHLANAMRFNTTLTKLSLNQNYIHEGGVISLGTACQEQCSLRNISLLENSVTSVAARELARFVAGNTTLHSLQLSWCVNSAHEVSAFREWQLTSQVNTTLCMLSLPNTPLLLNQCLGRQEKMLSQHSLTMLNLSHCSLHPPDMAFVAAFLAYNTVLKSLDVSENHILDPGGVDLARALEHNDKLVSLALRDNGITGVGLASLFRAMQTNTSVVSLDLCMNNMGSPDADKEDLQAAYAGRDMLAQNQTLTHLFMDYVSISSEQGKVLVQGVVENFTLKRFTFTGTDFSEALQL